MGTNSIIGIFNKDNVDWRSCNYDGYILGVGRYLLQVFNTDKLARKVVNVGYTSSLQDVPTQKADPSTIRTDTLDNFVKSKETWEFAYLRETPSSVKKALDGDRKMLVDENIYKDNPNGFWIVMTPESDCWKYLKDAYISEMRKEYISDKSVWNFLVENDGVDTAFGLNFHEERYRLLEIMNKYQNFFKNFDLSINEMNLLSTIKKVENFFNEDKSEITEIYSKLLEDLKDLKNIGGK